MASVGISFPHYRAGLRRRFPHPAADRGARCQCVVGLWRLAPVWSVALSAQLSRSRAFVHDFSLCHIALLLLLLCPRPRAVVSPALFKPDTTQFGPARATLPLRKVRETRRPPHDCSEGSNSRSSQTAIRSRSRGIWARMNSRSIRLSSTASYQAR